MVHSNTNYSRVVNQTLPVGKKGLWLTDKSPAFLNVLAINWCDMIEVCADDENGEFGGEFEVYFDPAQWDTGTAGLVYTDSDFLIALRAWFTEQGIVGADTIDYTEQGMQTDDYVSLEGGRAFALALIAKFGQ